MPTLPKDFMFHNILLCPGVTSLDGQNPGYATLQIDQLTNKAHDLKMTFLTIEKTYGWT
jgi:hypothetical protein